MRLVTPNREPINVENDYAHYETLEACQKKYKDNDTQKNPVFSTGATVTVQWEGRGLWMHSVIVEPNCVTTGDI